MATTICSIVVYVILLFVVWCLCRMAKDSDREDEEIIDSLRNKTPAARFTLVPMPASDD